MNSIVICSLLVGMIVGSTQATPEWEAFKGSHGKKYSSKLEESLRKSIFMNNRQKIEAFNRDQANDAGFTMKLNQLSDRSHDEKINLNSHRIVADRSDTGDIIEQLIGGEQKIPDSLDWREVPGRVGPVKRQGDCGGCWAFASIGALEGQLLPRNVTFRSLSEQNLIDCSKWNDGCDGGFIVYGLQDVAREGGIQDEQSYPYEGVKGECRFNRDKSVIMNKNATDLPIGDEDTLRKTVARFGPVPVTIDASLDSFLHYHQGIYYDPQCSWYQLNHAVLVVGYGTDEKHGDYWIVKNSYGEEWGDKGYIKMARNRKNNCGIATRASIPTF